MAWGNRRTTAIRGKPWACSGKETDSERCTEAVMLWRLWTHTLPCCRVREAEEMACMRAEAGEGREAGILAFERASVALRGMNFDSISGAQAPLAPR